MPELMKPGTVIVQSLVSQRNGEPVVQLTLAGGAGQMSPAKAKMIGLMLIEAAEAATSDAFLVSYMQSCEIKDPQKLAFLVKEFRAYREDRCLHIVDPDDPAEGTPDVD